MCDFLGWLTLTESLEAQIVEKPALWLFKEASLELNTQRVCTGLNLSDARLLAQPSPVEHQ